jgi:hypothetical protein
MWNDGSSGLLRGFESRPKKKREKNVWDKKIVEVNLKYYIFFIKGQLEKNNSLIKKS